MKYIIQIERSRWILAIFLIGFCSCSTWHYKNPRVKVEIERPNVDLISIEESKAAAETSTSQSIMMENVVPAAIEPSAEVASNEKTIALSSNNENRKINFPDKQSKIKKGKFGLFLFTEKIIDQSRLFKAKDVQKSALSGWLRLMIIFFAVGLILIVTGAIFSVFIHGGVGWLFYLFGSLCILAGFIFLILGLVGVMS